MHSLEAACNEAQSLIDKVGLFQEKGESCNLETIYLTSTVAGPSWSSGIQNLSSSSQEISKKSRVLNIRHRLKEIYLEECHNTQPFSSVPVPLKNLKRGSRLLEKLVQKDNLNTLIVNLYPGNKGYSLSLRLQGKTDVNNQAGRSQGSEPVIETMRWPYSDEELLRCIDNEEIPATLVDLLEANHSELFYQGCVIAEIRDYRLTFPFFSFETHHVLLRPTTQSIINDVNIISSSQDFSAEDRLSLESQIVLATAPPLCLDPNPAVGILINNLQHKKQRLSTAPLRRTARKFSQVTVNRKRKLDQFTSHNTLKLYDFISRKRTKLRAANQGKQNKKNNDGVLPPAPPVPTDERVQLPPPTIKPDVFKFAKQYEKLRETTDCSIHLVEEYILETERGQGRIYRIKLSILQRHSNLEYLGELYVDRDYKEGEQSGASCRFVLGTRVHANRYIQQFTEIFTEEGRKSVRITHVVPGQQHQVSYTPGMRERNAVAAAKKTVQTSSVGVLGKQTSSIISNTQNSALNQNQTLQTVLSNSQHLAAQTGNVPESLTSSVGSTISLSSQQIQKLQGQLSSSTNTNLLPQSSTPNSSIQISSVPHLTSLLSNSSMNAPPNANVHQIQQGQNVIGITGQSLGSLGQSVQNLVNVQNIGIANQNVSSSTIQSLLGNALSTSVVSDENLTDLSNGPVSSVITASQNILVSSSSTVHHPPTQSQISASKTSRPPIATNPAISALVTSLMNSAQQFQVQQAAQQAANSLNSANTQSSAASNNNQNSTILSLLNATTPLNINSGNVLTTSHVNLSQQNQKLINRKTITNLLNSRLINQNLSAVLNNNVINQTLVVNNANSQPLRVTLSSLNQLMNVSNQNSISQNQATQILNIGSVNQISSSPNATASFTIATTQGNITITTQATNLTTQTFTIANANSQTFTITSPNAVNSQTYSLNASSIALDQSQNQTYTITPNSTALSPQSFTISPANPTSLTNSNAAFTLSPTQNSGSQPQTFTVLQSNQNLGNQSFTITGPVGNQNFAVTNTQSSVGNQAFTITSSNISSLQNKTFQINNIGTNNQTFTIATPVVTVSNQFVNCQSSASNLNYSSQSSNQTFSTQPANTTSVFTVNSPLSSQVFTVNIPSQSTKSNFSSSFSNANQTNQGKNYSAQNSVLINKNQTFTINTSNQNFTVATPAIGKNIENVNISGKSVGNVSKNGADSGGSNVLSGKNIKDCNNTSGGNISNSSSGSCSINNLNNMGGRVNSGRLGSCQRRLSNSLQQISQNSELNKLLLEKSDTRLLADKKISDKNDSNSQILAVETKKLVVSENGKMSQSLSNIGDSGGNTSIGGPSSSSSSNSNLGLSMPGLSALLAGTPSADNPIPNASTSSSLLERLTSSAGPNTTTFSSPPLSMTPHSPSVSALSPNQNLPYQNNSFSTSPNSNILNSVSTNSPLSNLTSPGSNFTASSPKNQVQFQSSSPNSKDVIGITSPLSSPPGTGSVSLNLQGLSLQGLTGLQNVQVSIPGLAVPISLSLNVTGQAGNSQGVLMTSLAVPSTTNTSTTSSSSPMVLKSSGSSTSGSSNVQSFPVAQFMTSAVKNANQRASDQNSLPLAQGTPQSIQLVSSLQKSTVRSVSNQNSGTKTLHPVSPRGIINAQKNSLKASNNSGNIVSTGNQMLTFAAQQQLQLALQKQAQIQQCYQQNQKTPMSPPTIATRHRRRSNASDTNK